MSAVLLRNLLPSRFCFLLLLAFFGTSVASAQAVTTGIPSLPDYAAPGYVINSDRTADDPDFSSALYNRWYLRAANSISIGTTLSATTRYFRMGYRLMDGATPIALEGAAANGYLYTPFQSFTGPSLVVSLRNFSANLIPAAGVRLDPNKTYTIQAQRQEWISLTWTDAGLPSSSIAYAFIHFTGAFASDTAVNVVARANSISWARTYAVATVPAVNQFQVTVNLSLYRYDEPQAGAAGASDLVSSRIDYLLYDSADLLNPLATASSFLATNSNLLRNVNLGSGFTGPSLFTVNRTVSFRPAPGVQLDSPNRTYVLRATLSHTENPSTPLSITSNTLSSPAQQLLHFNGRVLFGAGGNQVVTTVNSITNNPATGAATVAGVVQTALTIPAGSGLLSDAVGHTYSGNVSVNLLANGDAVCRAGSYAVVAPASPDATILQFVRFERASTVLGVTGARSNLTIYLPTGLGWAGSPLSKRLSGRVTLDNVTLGSALEPLGDVTYLPPAELWVTEETRPLAYRLSRIVWQPTSGNFELVPFSSTDVVYHREEEYALLATAPVPGAERFKRSNDLYLRSVKEIDSSTLTVRPNSNRTALMSGQVRLQGGSFRAHFPYDAFIRWTVSGKLRFVDDLVVPADSFLDGTTSPAVTMPFGADCVDASCGAAPTSFAQLIADGDRLTITQNGGLVGAGILTAPIELKWGYINTMADYAHKAGTFEQATFHMPGHFISGGLNSAPEPLQGVGVILFSGTDLSSGLVTERPAKPAYSLGFAEYAGFNFRCGPPDSAASAYDGVSILAGAQYGPYDLKNRSKYYVRRGGVSGIHDKVVSAPETVDFYGYEVKLTNFGLAFLSNANTDSRTQGTINVREPSDIQQDFEKLLFACNGGLLSAEVPGGSNAQILAYWDAPIDVFAINFVRNAADQCDPGTGFLTLGVAGYASHVRETLFGTLGFLSNGNLIPKAFGLENVDSRLRMPAVTRIRGPKKQTGGGGYEEYQFTPVVDAYFNQLGSAPSFNPGTPASRDPQEGIISLAGMFKVPFFEQLKVHLHTASNRPPADPADAGSPWSVAVLSVADGTWSGSSFFGTSYFDESNRSFPTGSTVTAYFESASHYVRAKQEWLGGAITFNYPLVWSSSTRTFKSPQTEENDFVVLQMQHQVKFLSAERLELVFGAQYDGLPQINLTNLVFNAIDDATGVAQAAVQALTQTVVDQINSGVDRLAELLNDRIEEFYDRIFAATLDAPGGFLDDVYNDLAALWVSNNWTPANVNLVLTQRFNPLGPLGSLKGDVLGKLAGASETALQQIDAILDALDAIEGALDAVSEIAVPTVPEFNEAAKKLAARLVEKLATEVNGNLAAVLGGAGAYEKIADLLDPLLEELQPTLEQIRSVLVEIKTAFDGIRERLDTAGGAASDFLIELRSIFQTANDLATGEFGTLSTEVRVELSSFFGDFGVGFGLDNFQAFSPEEIKQRIRQEIMDRFGATQYVAAAQVAIKQQVQDLANSLTSATDSVFAQINEAVKGVLQGALAEIDNSINGLLGDISKYMGAGKIDGYAYFQGDAMRKVRLDGEFTWEIPEETTLKAFLEINQYTSEGDGPPCTPSLPANMTATEVIIGAIDVGCGFIGLDIKVDVTVKLSFEGTNAPWSLKPIGIAGSFAMTDGEISFEAFTLTELAAGVAFGKYENYITAALGMRIGEWGARGGVFFGRTCTIDPIKLWDPFAAEALGDPNPTFTGGYVYGEAHIPVSEALLGIPASCFFKITADAGVGVFYFLEGPTYGGRLGLGVNGEILCLLSIGGRIDMIGLKQADVFRFKGRGSVFGELGWCDFCIKVSKSVTMETEVGSGGKMKGKQSTK